MQNTISGYRLCWGLTVLIVLGIPRDVVAQEQVPKATADGHRWLARFVGEWTSVAKTENVEGVPPMECTGTMSSRTLGDFWVVNDVQGELAGTQIRARQTLGFDPLAGKFIGTWVDSVTPYQWVYDGALSGDGLTLTLEADGPNPADPGKLFRFRDVYEFSTPDEFTMTSSVRDANGQWTTFMRGRYTRKR